MNIPRPLPIFFSLFIFVFFFTGNLFGAEALEDTLTRDYREKSQNIQKILDKTETEPSPVFVKEGRAKLKDITSALARDIGALEKELSQLETVFSGIESSDPVTTEKETSLSEFLQFKQQKQVRLVELRLLLLQAEDAYDRISKLADQLQTLDLLYRDDSLFKGLKEKGGMWKTEDNADIEVQQLSRVLWFSALFALALLFCSLRRSSPCFFQQPEQKNRFLLKVGGCLNDISFFGRIFFGGVLVVSLFSPMIRKFPGEELFHSVLVVLLCYVLLVFMVQVAWRSLVDKRSEKEPFTYFENCTIHLFSFTQALVFAVNNNYVLFQPGPVSRIAVLCCWLISFSFISRSITPAVLPLFWKRGKWFFHLVLLMILLVEVMGYRNLTDFLIGIFTSTFAIIFAGFLFFHLTDPFVDFLTSLKSKLIARVLPDFEEYKGGFETSRVLRAGLKLYLVLIVWILVIHSWGIGRFSNEQLADFFYQGIQFDGFTFSPVRITLALFLFVICWPLVGFIKQLLDRNWLTTAGFASSTRDSLLAVTGYVSYALLVLILLGISGVKLTGLTIIVGALSVGIGFGLQNIVNNFISGLILVFERPIKRGDWIVVGSTEGYVKKISIRATIIQTFDRADVIVPNSDLISSQVTNMMFNDHRGRLRISVGVAYGSDTELVQKLLLEVANNHEQVISDGSVPVPRAWFQTFGDSSLNFDLLCHIHEIDMKLQIRSELNIAIDKILKKHNISIPFPQRDIHIIEKDAS